MAANTQVFRVEYGLDVNLDATIGKGLSVNNTASFGNNVVIEGDLTVKGATLFNNLSEVELGAGDLVFLSGETGSATNDVNITVNRGTDANVSIRWDESANQWQFTDNGTNYFPFKSYSELVYQFSTLNSTNIDPGTGKFRFNNGTPSLVTQISIDVSEYGGTEIVDYIDSFDDGNSSSKGFLLFRSSTDRDNVIIFNIATITTQTGYRQFNVTHVSGDTLFANDDIIFMSFARAGDKGEKGQKGEVGDRIISGTFSEANNSLEFQYSDGTTFTVNGVKGDKGQKGEVEKGQKGDSGSKGDTGAPSTVKGDQGAQGIKGDKGDPGAKGDVGPTGVGQKGDKGEVGVSVKGEKGDQGIKGDTGAASTVAGPSGPTGQKGQKGDTGSTGPTGPSGPTGSSASLPANAYFQSIGVNTSAPSLPTFQGFIHASGDIIAYYSDLRLKTNIEEIKDATEKLLVITGVYYSQNELAEKFGYNDYSRQLGLIAQEVQKICPEAVKLAPFDIDENGASKSGENFLTIKYERLVPLLVQAIKELNERIKKLESK